MNGKAYDKILEDMEAKKELKRTNVAEFCKYVVDLTFAMRNYRYTDSDTQDFKENERTYGKYHTITGNYHFQKLKNDVDNNKCNLFTYNFAMNFYQQIYEYYKMNLSERVNSFNETILKQIEKYESELKRLKTIDDILKKFIISATILLTIFLFLDLFPNSVRVIISSIIAGAAILDKIFGFSDKNLSLFGIVHTMRDHYNRHYYSLEPYDLPTGASLDLFINNIYYLIQKKNDLDSAVEKRSQEQIQELVSSRK